MKRVVYSKARWSLIGNHRMYDCELECGCRQSVRAKKLYTKSGPDFAGPPKRLKCRKCEEK